MDEMSWQWITGFAIFAAFNCLLAVLYCIECKQRRHVKCAIAKIVLVCVSVLGFVLTDFILRDKGLPPLLSLVWFVIYWTHLVIAVINWIQDVREAHAAKRQTAATVAQPSQEKGALFAEQTDQNGAATDNGTSNASDR